MSKHHQWLARQIPQWLDEGIISQGQADVLAERYPHHDTLGLGRLLLTGIAAVMIGLGVILLFAYNWSEMGKFSKLAVIFTALVGAHLLALFTRSRNHVYSEGLFALGTMLMGAGIFLVGQIYHMDSHYPTAFLIWSVGALGLAWTLPSLTQAFMAVVLVIGWHLTEVFDFAIANHAVFVPILLGVFPLVWRLRSVQLARLVSAALLLSLGLTVGLFNEELVVVMLLLTATTLIGLARFAEISTDERQRQIGAYLGKPAVVVVVAVMYLMSFTALVPELTAEKLHDATSAAYLALALLASQAVYFWLLHRRAQSPLLHLAELSALLVLLPTLAGLLQFDMQAHTLAFLVSLGFNLVLLVMSVWLMVDGAKQANRSHMMKGSILFALLAAARYVDLFESLISRALVFLLVGVALFAVSHLYQRNKRQVRG